MILDFDRPRSFGGLFVVTHPDRIKHYKTLKQRWCSWPWKPWRGYTWVRNPIYPNDHTTVRIGDTLHMTETMWERLQARKE